MKFFKKKKANNKVFAQIFGTHSVIAALQNPKRIHRKLYIVKNQDKILTDNIKKIVPEIIKLNNQEMFKIFGNEKNHQGIVLETSDLQQPSLDKLIEESKKKKSDVIIILDQVTDPNNIGSIMRSCALFNCKSIIVSNYNSPEITSSMVKAASGALELVNYISVVNLSRTMIKFKKNDYWIYGFENNEKNNQNNKLEFPKKIVLVFGSEGKGLRNLIKKECDEIISIPINAQMKYKIDSLNVSNACTIALYEHFKKNN
tara:strand:- start:388 stop:1161 length:774 start_codon:yes stop_codon:yes gene_type:complete